MYKKYVTRRLAVQVAQAWNFGWGKAMERVYGVSLTKTLVYRDQKKTDYYVDKRQHEIYVRGLYTLLEDEKFLRTFHRNAKGKLEIFLTRAQKKLLVDFSNYSNKELLKLYTSFVLPTSEQFYVHMWTVFNIGEPLANVVQKELEKKFNIKKVIQKYLLNLSSPLKPNDVINKRIDLLKIVISKKDNNLVNLTKKYKHIPMFDFDHSPYSATHFKKELQSVRNPRKELTNLKKHFKNQHLLFDKTLKDIKPNKYQKILFKFLKENVYLRDYRDMLRQKYNLCLRNYYLEIGKRLGLKINEVAILSNAEIIKYLASNKKFSKKIAVSRSKAYLLLQNNDKVNLYSGLDAIKRSRKILKEKISGIRKIITGIVGSPGLAQGRVKIIYTNKDLHKVKKGEVMVASMTRQDYVPAMRKASAIVTDEGSITCHAAIIARELKIPCIVGTKYSTRILKDGIKVVVDANKGLVIKK